MKEIAKLSDVSHTCIHGSVMALADEHRLDLIHTLKNMSATETYQLYISWLNMKNVDHFNVLNDAVNSHKRRKDDV